MNDAKRQRREEPFAEQSKSRDVWDEDPTSRETIRSSWFQEPSTTLTTLLACWHPGIPDEILALQRQLVTVKRRLNRPGFVQARSASNPYEELGRRTCHNLFLNRSALKLANLDALLDFRLTMTTDGSGHFTFVDLCGAPGGFSEYLLRTCQSNRVLWVQGFGMSLLGKNEHGCGLEWKVGSETMRQGDCILRYDVCEGHDGTGDIYVWDNTLFLQQVVQSVTDCDKVHLVVADGGFDAQRDSERQEELAQKMIVCEVAAAIQLLRVGGHFVIKMFGFQTPTMRLIMAELSQLFEEVHVIKPIVSRPASAERYLCGMHFRGQPPGWDGERWKSVALFGLAGNQKEAVNRAIDVFDRDLLLLNLKACFAILTLLDEEHKRDDRSVSGQVPVDLYLTAWRLDR